MRRAVQLITLNWYGLLGCGLAFCLLLGFLPSGSLLGQQTAKVSGTKENVQKDKKEPPLHNWHSNVSVARKVIEKFENTQSYSADFRIDIKEGSRSRHMLGHVYYQKPGKVRYEFAKPSGNLIVSDGRIMWFYVKRLNTVGKQQLDLKTKTSSGSSVFHSSPLTGVKRLFRKYHYRFDKAKQPRVEQGGNFFVLDLEQREKIGGYEKMKLYIDAKTYLIKRAVGDDGYGKTSTIEFSKIEINTPLGGKLFQYKPDNGVVVVSNPLVNQ